MAKRFKKKKGPDNGTSTSVAGTRVLGQSQASFLSQDWLWGLILVLAVILAYQPVWYAGFVWDDDTHLTANRTIIGPLGLREIWTNGGPLQSFPLVITTFWLEHALWGLEPLPYHLVNVFLQAACAILLWLTLRSLQVRGAWLGAALWALHPLQVESVAWISELKNTESCVFYLLTIYFFVRSLRSEEKKKGIDRDYVWTLIFAALAMASKPSTVVLPAVLFLCAWWMEGRWNRRNLLRLIPVAAMTVAATLNTVIPRPPFLLTAAAPPLVRTWPERIATAGDAIWFYLGKLVWPHPLLAVYPRWQIDAGQWLSYLSVLAALLGWAILWLKRDTPFRPLFFAVTYFLVVLSPFLGLIDQSFWVYSFVEDHLQYLAAMGPLALAGAGMAWLADFAIPKKPWLQSTLGAGVLIGLGMLSWLHAWAYESEETLWTDTLAKNPVCWVGHNNLGVALSKKGRKDEALAHFQKSVEIYPDYSSAHYNLGNTLNETGRLDEAITQYQKALAIDPHYADAYNNLGTVLTAKGRVDEAIADYQKALEFNPNIPRAHNDLGSDLLKKGRFNEALVQFQKALQINPNDAVAHFDLGIALSQNGRMDEAIAQYQTAVEIKPDYAEARNNLGNVLLQKGQLDDAIAQFEKAVEVDPGYIDALFDLGNALLQKGQVDDAIAQFEKALKIKPDFAEAYVSLGAAYGGSGRLDKAIAEFQEAVKLRPDFAAAQQNLARAQAMVRQGHGAQ